MLLVSYETIVNNEKMKISNDLISFIKNEGEFKFWKELNAHKNVQVFDF